MAVLNDLPNEILIEVIKDFDLHSLCQFAKMSQRFARLARQLILKDVVLTNQTHEKLVNRSRLFMRSVQEKPVLLAYIRTFRAREKSPFTPIISPKDTDPSPFVPYFNYGPPTPWLINDDLGPFPNWVDWLLSTKSMVFLDTLQLAGAWINIASVIELMFIGQLRVLELEYDLFGSHFLFRKTPKHSARTAPTLTLDLGYMPLFGNMLELILAWPRALEQLRCAMVCVRREATELPGDETSEEDLGFDRDPPEDPEPQPISPALVVKSLESTKSSLVKLELLEFIDEWEGHDGSSLDLSEFSSLQVAKIPALCFPWMKSERYEPPMAMGVYKLLPRSLKHLTVVYSASEKVIARSEDWLIELAEQQLEHLPNLASVTMKIRMRPFHDDNLKLECSEKLDKAMKAALFHFSIEPFKRFTDFFWEKYPTHDDQDVALP